MFNSLKEKFSSTDLNSRNSPGEHNLSRFSSISSLVSDVGSAFSKALTIPQHVQPVNRSATQFFDSESVSEYDDSIIQGDTINKEELFLRYQKAQSLAKRYKTRSMEMVECYKRLELENSKLTQTLTESQDHNIRKVSELREEMKLDRQAKNDVEENYQLMIDEKNELINVLRLQISLLKEGKELPIELESQIRERHDMEIKFQKSRDEELKELKNALSHRENLLQRCKEKITSLNSQLTELQTKYDNANQDIETADALREQFNADMRKQRFEHAILLENLRKEHNEKLQSLLCDFEEKKNVFESKVIADFENKKLIFQSDLQDKILSTKKQFEDLNMTPENDECEKAVDNFTNTVERSSCDRSNKDLNGSNSDTKDMGIFYIETEEETFKCMDFISKKENDKFVDEVFLDEKFTSDAQEINSLKYQLSILTEVNINLEKQVKMNATIAEDARINILDVEIKSLLDQIKDLQVLKSEREELILRLQNDILNLEDILKTEKENFEIETRNLSQVITRTEEELHTLKGQMCSLEKENVRLKEEVTIKEISLDDDRVGDLKAEIVSLSKQIKELEAIQLQKDNQLLTYQAEIKKVEITLRKDNEELEGNKIDLESKLSIANNEIRHLSEENQQIKEDLIIRTKLIEDTRIDDLKEKIPCLLSQLEEMKEINSKLNVKKHNLEEKFKNLELCFMEEKNKNTKKEEEMLEELKFSKLKVDEVNLDLESKNLKIEEFLQCHIVLEEANANLTEETNKVKEENSELDLQVQSANKAIEDIHQYLKKSRNGCENSGISGDNLVTALEELERKYEDTIEEYKLIIHDLKINIENITLEKEELRLTLLGEEKNLITMMNTLNKESLDFKSEFESMKNMNNSLLDDKERLTTLMAENEILIRNLQKQNENFEIKSQGMIIESELIKEEALEEGAMEVEVEGPKKENVEDFNVLNESLMVAENMLIKSNETIRALESVTSIFKKYSDIFITWNENLVAGSDSRQFWSDDLENDSAGIEEVSRLGHSIEKVLLFCHSQYDKIKMNERIMRAVVDLSTEFDQLNFEELQLTEVQNEGPHTEFCEISKLRRKCIENTLAVKEKLKQKEDFIKKLHSEKEALSIKCEKMKNERSQHFRNLVSMFEMEDLDLEQKSFSKAVMKGLKEHVKRSTGLSFQLSEALSRLVAVQGKLDISTEECQSKQSELNELRETVSENRNRLLSTREELERSVRRLNEFADEKGRIDEEKQSLRKELNQLNEKIQELKLEFEKQSIEKQKLEKQFDESLEKVKINHLALEENYKKEIEKQYGYQHYLEMQIKAQQDENNRQLTENVHVSNIKLEEVLKQSEQLLVLNHQYKELLDQTKAESVSVTNRLKDLELNHDLLEQEKLELTKERNRLQAELDSIMVEKKESLEAVINLQSSKDCLEAEKRKYFNQVQSFEAETLEKSKKINIIQESHEKIQRDYQSLMDENQKLRNELQNVQDNCSFLESQNKDLKRFQIKIESLKSKLKSRKNDHEKEIFEIKQQFSEDKSCIEDDHNHRVKKLAKDFNDKMLMKEQDFQKTFHDALQNVRMEESRQKADLKSQIDYLNLMVIELETERNCLLNTISDSDEAIKNLRLLLVTKEDQHNIMAEEISNYKVDIGKLELHLSDTKSLFKELDERTKVKEIVDSHSFCEDATLETVNVHDHDVLQMHCTDLEEQVRKLNLENISLKETLQINQTMSSTPILHVKSHNLSHQPSFDIASLKNSNFSNSVTLRSPNTSCSEYQFCPYPITDATEYEYLRDILVKYMTGMETVTLARVLCTVMKLSADETDRILRFEQHKKKTLQVIF